MSMSIKTLPEAIQYFSDTLGQHPERDALAAQAAVVAGRPRRYPVLYLNHRLDPADPVRPEPFFRLSECTAPDTVEGRLARRIVGLLAPLDMLNPVTASLGLGRSPADLIPCFGIPASADGGAAAYTRPLAAMLAEPEPEPETAGPMPEWAAQIQAIKQLTPPAFKIGLPDMQGPFNLVHAMIGNDAFEAPYSDPEGFHAFMARVTTFWIAARELLVRWAGPERLAPAARWPRLAECSVNLVSERFYREFVLPHDLRIAKHFGGVSIHPCSGLHVFRVTLQELPGVCASEAGLMIAPMAAPCVSVPEAMRLIAGRPIALAIGQELPADFAEAEALFRRDLDLAAGNPRLTFGHTGIFWRNQHRPRIRELHRQLDAYWDRQVLPLQPVAVPEV